MWMGSPTTGTLNLLDYAQITFWTYFGFKMANVTKGYDFRVIIILYTSIVKLKKQKQKHSFVLVWTGMAPLLDVILRNARNP